MQKAVELFDQQSKLDYELDLKKCSMTKIRPFYNFKITITFKLPHTHKLL